MLLCHSHLIFGKISVEIFCPFTLGFFFYYHWVISILYIFWKKSFIRHDLQIFFPQFVAHLFIVFTVSLEEPKFLHLIKSNSSVFFLVWIMFSALYLKKPLPKPRSQRSSLTFSPISFLILGFTFRSMIHFYLIFMYCTKYKFKFLFWGAYGYPLVLASFLEKTFPSPLKCLCTSMEKSHL